MNVLNPPKLRVGDRLYRVESSTPFAGFVSDIEPSAREDDDDTEELNEYNDDQSCKAKPAQVKPARNEPTSLRNENAQEDEELDFEAKIEKDGRFSTTLFVSDAFLGVIIGKKGDTKREIEMSTQTEVRIPPKRNTATNGASVAGANVDGVGNNSGGGVAEKVVTENEQRSVVSVLGKTKRSLASARCRIEQLVEKHKRKLPYTHFISLPVNKPLILQRAMEFKELVLRSCIADRGVDESLFLKPEKMHMTICMLVLYDADELRAARCILDEYAQRLRTLLHGKLRVRIRGLEIMNDDPNSVDVLFAKVECCSQPSNVLQTIADELLQRFSRFRFREDFRVQNGVRLHVTVMNSKLRNEVDPSEAAETQQKSLQTQQADPRKKGDAYGYRNGPRESFDAANILQRFRNFDFGEVELDCLHLSRRFHLADDGHYANDAVLTFE